jgi:glycosyltransferase involved in cell wall biosynthesis
MIQLLRKCPPGFGGVERVAHELATALTSQGDSVVTFCLIGRRSDRNGSPGEDPLPVVYSRVVLPALRAGKLRVVLPLPPLWAIINSRDPLLLHLPCLTILLIGIFASLVNKQRKIYVYWHAFLESSNWLISAVYQVYEWLALQWLSYAKPSMISTSPVLAACLDQKLRSPGKTSVLPCCLSQEVEDLCLSLSQCNMESMPDAACTGQGLKIAFVGRSCTYKRIDLLIRAFACSRASELYLIGHGDWMNLQLLADSIVPASKKVFFLGCLEEAEKIRILATCDMHVLPSFSSNEAFGIAQLEAMACGLAACSPQIPKSGMCWVNGTASISCDGDVVVSIADAINQLNDPSIRLSIKAACHHRYHEMFSRRAWLQQLRCFRLTMAI